MPKTLYCSEAKLTSCWKCQSFFIDDGYCPPPSQLENDRFIFESPKDDLLIGSTIGISCKAGYYMSKSAVIACESNQKWSIPAPDICQRIQFHW